MKDPREQQSGNADLGVMAGRISFFEEMVKQPLPLMFIDSPLPHHQRLNYALIGDTASENPNFQPMMRTPHGFQIGMVQAEAGNGPAYHTHDYIEGFMPLTDHTWRFYWGEDETKVDGEVIIGKWDFISLPPKLWRGFEVCEGQEGTAWIVGVLEAHKVFEGKDPYWSPYVKRAAKEQGFIANDKGKMVLTPDDLKQREQEIMQRIEGKGTGRG